MRLLIVDDHPIVISACRALLANDLDISVSGVHTLAHARLAMRDTCPDIVVLDLNLPDGSSLDLVREIAAGQPSTRIIVFSAIDAPMIALQAIRYGANGFLGKVGRASEFREAVLAVASGETWLSDSLAQELALMKVRGKPSRELLSVREQQIMTSLAKGQNFAQIATSVAVSYWTVARECENLKNKLKARNASELIRIAVEMKLV